MKPSMLSFKNQVIIFQHWPAFNSTISNHYVISEICREKESESKSEKGEGRVENWEDKHKI